MSGAIEIVLITLAVFIAGIFRGFSGFGTGMILVPILSLIYEPVVAVVTVVLLELVPALQLLRASILNCHWQSVLPMAVISALTVPLGAFLLVTIDANTMRILIALLVLACVMVLSTGWRYKKDTGYKTSAVTGLTSGLITGATSLGGLPAILYYMSSKHSARVARASMIIFLLITTIITLVTYTAHGIISKDILVTSGWLVPFFIIAISIGEQLFGRVSEPLFRAITLSMMGSVSVVMLVT
jgi:hypothetical protein